MGTRISTPAQKEGVDFILLHEGPKLFWRLHTTIDIMIYYHREDDCLEIIGFDQDRFKEYKRIYMSYSKMKKITSNEAQKKFREVVIDRESHGYRGPPQSDE